MTNAIKTDQYIAKRLDTLHQLEFHKVLLELVTDMLDLVPCIGISLFCKCKH